MTDEPGPGSAEAAGVSEASSPSPALVGVRRARQDPDEAGDVGAERVLELEEAEVAVRAAAGHLPRRLVELLADQPLRLDLRPRRVVDDEVGQLAVRPPGQHRSEQLSLGVHRQRRRHVDEQLVGRGGRVVAGGDARGEACEGVGAVALPERGEGRRVHAGDLGDRGEPLVLRLDGAGDRRDHGGVQRHLEAGHEALGARLDDGAERLADGHESRRHGGARLGVDLGRLGGLVVAAGGEGECEQGGEQGCAERERWSHQDPRRRRRNARCRKRNGAVDGVGEGI